MADKKPNALQTPLTPSAQLAAIVGSMHALDIAQFLKTVHETRGRGGGMPHFTGDIRHGELFGCAEVAQKVKLSEGDVATTQVLGEVEQEFALTEEDEVCDFTRITLSASAFGSGWCGHNDSN